MQDAAFKTLGIEQTTDARLIRNAFVRLARIYHPDRFVGMPDDVRAEAERRMKDVTAAYEQIRAWKGAPTPRPAEKAPQRQNDAWERAKLAREAVARTRSENERSRARWRLWVELERQARDRAEWDARLATLLADDGASPPAGPVREAPAVGGSLDRRIDQARQAQRGGLVPLRDRAD